MNRKIREIMSARENGESGFTLIELLVVIIIIGILASIAIPIFMNQQKTARDSATTSDVKNVATNIQSGLTRYPDADFFAIGDDTVTDPSTLTEGAAATDTNGNGKVNVFVGDGSGANEFETYTVSLSKGTQVAITTDADGTFVVTGYNGNGKSYTSLAGGLKYDSAAGGIKN